MNRRIRNRTYGGVEAGGGSRPWLSDYLTTTWTHEARLTPTGAHVNFPPLNRCEKTHERTLHASGGTGFIRRAQVR
jgi:hypothetical protein